MSRILDFADGFTSSAAPTPTASPVVEYASYANDAAYVSANGTAENGNAYHNTTDNTLRTYLNGAWREISVFEA